MTGVQTCALPISKTAAQAEREAVAEADRLAGELHARLRYASIDKVYEAGLHRFLGGVRDDIARLSDEIGRQFLLD